MTREPNPPALQEGDVLLYDEPGRCGGVDCHSHHFRLVQRGTWFAVLVRHGGGDERFDLPSTGRQLVPALAALDSDGRYWLLHTLYSTRDQAKQDSATLVRQHWRQAAAEGRIKTRKLRGQSAVKVWIEDAPSNTTHGGN